ncbi:MAG: hypothetical protein KKG60_01860 [Nanoarchaeota archaeon]|nr:hypothetical protein [Nanoarchaeota archaeon]
MKKILLSLIVCILMCSLVLAQGQQGIYEPGTGIENPETKEAGQGTGRGLEVDTQNQGEETNLQNQQRVREGSYMGEGGQQMMIQEKANNQMQLKVNGVSANYGLNLTQKQVQNKTKLQVKLSNGKNAEIKVMPNTASETALQSLRLKNCVEEEGCSIELKEVGQGEQVKVAYEIKVQKQYRFLGLFKTKMQVQAQVDAENGEVIQSKKPWWAFLASESEE